MARKNPTMPKDSQDLPSPIPGIDNLPNAIGINQSVRSVREYDSQAPQVRSSSSNGAILVRSCTFRAVLSMWRHNSLGSEQCPIVGLRTRR